MSPIIAFGVGALVLYLLTRPTTAAAAAPGVTSKPSASPSGGGGTAGGGGLGALGSKIASLFQPNLAFQPTAAPIVPAPTLSTPSLAEILSGAGNILNLFPPPTQPNYGAYTAAELQAMQDSPGALPSDPGFIGPLPDNYVYPVADAPGGYQSNTTDYSNPEDWGAGG